MPTEKVFYKTTCWAEEFLTALDLYDGTCGPAVAEIRKIPGPTDSPVIPDKYEVYPLDVEDPNRYWTRVCQRCKDAITDPYQERPLA